MKPRITIIGTGSEITAGRSIDTNSGWIANELFSLGWKVRNFLALPDDPKVILEEFRSLQSKVSQETPVLVILTGGLGPTEDDYTLECVKELLNVSSYVVERARIKLESIYKSRGKSYEDILPTVLRQTQVPEGSFVLENSVGIAPGFAISIGENSYLVCMPGVPSEMKEMFTKRLVPFLKRTYSRGNLFQQTRWVWNKGESLFQSEFVQKQQDLLNTGLTWGVTAQKGFIKAIFQSEDESKVEEMTNRLTAFYGDQSTQDIFQSLHQHLLSSKETLSVAESCTSGLLGKRITDMPGASSYFLGGVISYSNQEKVRQLQVSEESLKLHGAVSEEVAKQMAKGMQHGSGSTHALSVTGIAGPEGGSAEKPVGTVWIGYQRNGEEPFAVRFQFPGNRDTVREISANVALYVLYQAIFKRGT